MDLREKIERQTAEFLARGGVITELPGFDGFITPYPEHRDSIPSSEGKNTRPGAQGKRLAPEGHYTLEECADMMNVSYWTLHHQVNRKSARYTGQIHGLPLPTPKRSSRSWYLPKGEVDALVKQIQTGSTQ